MALGKVKVDRLYLDSNTPSSTGTTPHLANAVLLRAASGQTQLQTLALPATSANAGQTLVASFVETETVDGVTRNVTRTSWSDGDSVDMTETRIAPLRLLTTATVEAASLAELSIGRSTMQNVTFAAGVTVAHVVRLSPSSTSGVEAQHYALSAGPPAEAPEDVAPLGVVLQSAAAGASGSVLTAGVTVVRTFVETAPQTTYAIPASYVGLPTTLQRGVAYTLTYPGSHPLRLSETAGGTFSGGTEYTAGVDTTTYVSNTLSFTLPANAPDTLHFYCTSHGSMGSAPVNVVDASGAIPAGAALVVDTRTTGAAAAAGTVMSLADWRALGTTLKTFVVGRALLTKPAGEQLVVAAVERPTLCA